MKDNWTKTQEFARRHPMETLAVVVTVISTLPKMIDSVSAAQGRRAYAKQVKYSTRRRR